MSLTNVKLPVVKAPTFKVANFRAPKVKFSAKTPRTGISAKPIRPASIKVLTKGVGLP